MEPNQSLETGALRFIYTENLVVFQDSRDSLLRVIEDIDESLPSPSVSIAEPIVSNNNIAEPEKLVVPNIDEKEEIIPIKEEVGPVVSKPKVEKIRLIIHGNNKRNILVLLPGLKNELTVEERDFLLKILAAKQLKGNDIGFVFEGENGTIINKSDLLLEAPQLVIAFGVKKNLMALMPSIPYSLIAEDSVLYLKSDTLLKLPADSNLKKQLRSQLQPRVLA
jgi:hypothetical protein